MTFVTRYIVLSYLSSPRAFPLVMLRFTVMMEVKVHTQMSPRTGRVVALVVSLLLLLVAISTVAAWWSGWYPPNFAGSYSPSSYRHGQWNDSWNNSEAFGSEFQFNSTKQSGVRYYSQNNHYLAWWCPWCKGYYTQDHTDMSNRLSAIGYSTNVPDPKVDSDDDDNNGNWEELEVVSVNQSFPVVGTTYYFRSYFSKRSTGTGYLLETPAISARPTSLQEYNTVYYESRPQTLGYNTTSGLRPLEAPPVSVSEGGEIAERYVDNEQGPGVVIRANMGQPFVSLTLDTRQEQFATLGDYALWAKGPALDQLRLQGVTTARTVVTFHAPVSMARLDELIGTYGVEAINAIYVDRRNADPLSNVWTFGLLDTENSQNYQRELDRLVRDVMRRQQSGGGRMRLELVGVTSVRAWLPVDVVASLNSSSDVYLADASATYMRMVATKAGDSAVALSGTPLPDGFSHYLTADVSDLYVEKQESSMVDIP